MHVIYVREKRWQKADNHMDCRHCPECGATVNGWHGQRRHQRWHEELADILNSRAEVEADQPVPWTAAVGEEADHAEIS